jgi:hypothetical protein
MLKYFTAAALTLVSIPAFADATGGGFCNVMQEGITACGDELAATKSHQCPNAIKDVKASYAGLKDEPSKAMRSELANANAMWMDLAQTPTKVKLKGAGAAIEKECKKLKKLDQ